ncbi:MAG: endoglucanase [Bryobacterales bacterium]|nr:endoglucanase [Bryobacterales bacterium]
MISWVHAAFGICCLVLPAEAQSQTLLGIYYGNQGWKMEQVQAVEAWQGKKHAVVNLFTDWTNTPKVMNTLFGQQLPNIWNNGNVPMVTWEPFTGGQTPNDIEARIAAGQYNPYIANWAGRMKAFLSGPDGVYGNADDRRAYVRLGHEMNGNWYPWSPAVGGNSPLDYVAMWTRVRGVFSALQIDPAHLQWVWCVNAEDVGGFTAEQFYPGNDYVDWVAIDGYNWGASQTWSTWKSPSDIYGPMLARVRATTGNRKPVALTEFASTSATASGVSVPVKSTWIGELFAYASTNQIKMLCWFNTDKETDWAIFGGANGDGTYKSGRTTYKTYAAYKAAVTVNVFVTPSTANPRLITDAQFAGN